MLKRALIALSLANLCFIPAWREVVDPNILHHCYHTKVCPIGAQIVAVTVNSLLLTAIFFLGFELVGRSKYKAARAAAYVAFLFSFVFVLNGIRIQGPRLMPKLVATFGIAAYGIAALGFLAVLALGIWILLRFGLKRVAKGAAIVVLVLSPFVVIAYAQSLWVMVSYRRGVAEQSSVVNPKATTNNSSRVVWLIFDELDQRVAFEERPDSLQLPALDRLRAEALFARAAYPPSGSTLQSIPALVSGKLVADALRIRPDDLMVRFHEEPNFVSWRESPNLFKTLREIGMPAAITGYYHPYCRMFGADVTQCSWQEDSFTAESIIRRASLMENIERNARLSFLSFPILHGLTKRAESDQVDPVVLDHALQNYRELMGSARRIAVDPNVRLAFVHLPLPHPPSFYDRARGRIDLHRRNSYLDNLAMADLALAEIRRAMEDAGVWEETSVIVSSDHWWRARELWSPVTGRSAARVYWHAEDIQMQPPMPEYKVPFILKLPRQHQGVVYAPAFNTILSHDLVLALLRGDVQTAESAAGWLDSHRSFGVSPYNNVLLDLIQLEKSPGDHR